MIESTGEAFDALQDGTHYLAQRVDELIDEKNNAYSERNQLVAALSKLFPSHLWNEGWRWIVCIELPAGQASWHIHDGEIGLFEHLSERPNNWDGHTTEEKYERLNKLTPKVETATDTTNEFDATVINRMIADHLGFSVTGPPTNNYYPMQQWNYPKDWSHYVVSRPVTYLPNFLEMILKYKELLETVSPLTAPNALPKFTTLYNRRDC